METKMNFLITVQFLLILSLGVFTIDAKSLQSTDYDDDNDSLDSSDIDQLIIRIISSAVNHGEKMIPGWDVKVALDVNVIKLVDTGLEAGDLLGWNPDADIEDNLVNIAETYFNLLPFKGINSTKSVSDNVALLIDDIDIIPFPPFISKAKFQAKLIEKALDILSSIPDVNLNQSIHDNIVSWVSSSLEKVQIIDPSATAEKQVNYLIDLLFDEIKLPGFSPSKTLDANVVDVLEALLD